eukprot:COSAG02_NODE_206_length_29144_cov_12.855121_10_plen_66_part_00
MLHLAARRASAMDQPQQRLARVSRRLSASGSSLMARLLSCLTQPNTVLRTRLGVTQAGLFLYSSN